LTGFLLNFNRVCKSNLSEKEILKIPNRTGEKKMK